MEVDAIDPTVPEASTTPAEGEDVGTTPNDDAADPLGSPWDRLGGDEETTDDAVDIVEETVEPEGDTDTEGVDTTDEEPKEEEAPTGGGDEPTDLEKLFADDDDDEATPEADAAGVTPEAEPKGDEKPADDDEKKPEDEADPEKMPVDELLERQKNKYVR